MFVFQSPISIGTHSLGHDHNWHHNDYQHDNCHYNYHRCTMMIIIHTLKEVCHHFPSSLCNHFHLSCHKTVSWLYLSSGVLFPSVHTFCLMTTIVIMTITMVIGDVEKSFPFIVPQNVFVLWSLISRRAHILPYWLCCPQFGCHH